MTFKKEYFIILCVRPSAAIPDQIFYSLLHVLCNSGPMWNIEFISDAEKNWCILKGEMSYEEDSKQKMSINNKYKWKSK
jgi:hypothetical protein